MTRVKRKINLEKAIIALQILLDHKQNKEEKYQAFFEKHTIVFDILGYCKWWSFTKKSGNKLPKDISGKKPEPDFIVQRKDGLYEILELKTPFVNTILIDSNEYRQQLTSKISSYISQVALYCDYFANENNRTGVNSLFGMDLQEKLDITVVIGLKSNNFDRKKIDKQLKNYASYRVNFKTFDDILENLIDFYKKEFGNYENWQGVSFHCLVRFHNKSDGGKKYFFVFGDNERDSVSVYLDKYNNIRVEFRDKKSAPYDTNIESNDLILSKWVYLSFELGSKDGQCFFSISLEGREKERREKVFNHKIAINFRNAFLGCDLYKQNIGYFDLSEITSYNRILTLDEKYKLLSYFNKKKNSIETYLNFGGNKFMNRDPNTGNFVQNESINKPVIRRMRYP